MRKRIGAILLAVAALSVMVGMFSACSREEYTKEEISPILEELVTASYELNEIYFGEGLPISDNREDVEKFYDSFQAEVSLNYHPVSPDCGYSTIQDIRDATLAVFTEEYADYLFTMAFTGLTAVFDENTDSQFTKTVNYARYLEKDGVLTVRMNVIDEALPLGRTYDFSDFTILSQQTGEVVVEILSLVDGQPDLRVKLTLCEQPDGSFRLDTPTY